MRLVSSWDPWGEGAYHMTLFCPNFFPGCYSRTLRKLSTLKHFRIDLTHEDVCVDTVFGHQAGYSLLGTDRHSEYDAFSAVRQLYHLSVPSASSTAVTTTYVTILIP